MKCLCYLALLFVLYIQHASGQEKGKIDLKVFDSARKPLDGVMVQLIKVKDSSLALYTFTKQDGTAEFAEVGYGNYKISITQLGYKNYVSSSFLVDSAHRKLS